jgi:F-type H+-transporting ATPase subunit a
MHALESKIFYLFSFIPAAPGVVLPWVITLMIGSACWVATRRLSLEPGRWQTLAEVVYESLAGFIQTIVGPHLTYQLLPLLGTIFIYIFSANLLGLVPGLKSPTGTFSNCVGMALIVFFATHLIGIRQHGLKYLKHFWGDIWWMGPLMFPIHLIGELARPLSLTLRLFGNILGEDVVILVLTVYLFPLFLPVPMMVMAIFTSLLQALVFTILSGIYIAGALSDGH